MSMGQTSTFDDDQPDDERSPAAAGDLDVARDSDVPISTQIYWQLAYQIDSAGSCRVRGWPRSGSWLPPSE